MPLAAPLAPGDGKVKVAADRRLRQNCKKERNELEVKVSSILLVFSLVTQGCGTIIYGTRQDISINSNPPEATVTVDGITVTTPATVSLRRRKDHTVTVIKEGYEEAQAHINRSLNGWVTLLGNLIWFLPGSYVVTVLVDLLAGGGWTLEPETVNVNLEQKKGGNG